MRYCVRWQEFKDTTRGGIYAGPFNDINIAHQSLGVYRNINDSITCYDVHLYVDEYVPDNPHDEACEDCSCAECLASHESDCRCDNCSSDEYLHDDECECKECEFLFPTLLH